MGDKNFSQTTNGGSPQVNQGQEGGTATNITNNHGGEEQLSAAAAFKLMVAEMEALPAESPVTSDQLGDLAAVLEFEENFVEENPDAVQSVDDSDAPATLGLLTSAEDYPKDPEASKSTLSGVMDGVKPGAGWVKPMLPYLARIAKRGMGSSSGLIGIADEIVTIMGEG